MLSESPSRRGHGQRLAGGVGPRVSPTSKRRLNRSPRGRRRWRSSESVRIRRSSPTPSPDSSSGRWDFPTGRSPESARALELAAELGHPYSIAYALFHAALLDLWRADLSAWRRRQTTWSAWPTRTTTQSGERSASCSGDGHGRLRGRGRRLGGGGARLLALSRLIHTSHLLAVDAPRASPSIRDGRPARRGARLASKRREQCVGRRSIPLSADLAIMRGDLLMGLPSPDVRGG